MSNAAEDDIVYLACAASGRKVAAALDRERAAHAKEVADLRKALEDAAMPIHSEYCGVTCHRICKRITNALKGGG